MADVFDDLWHYGVSESFKTVHPRGYPMSHSTHVGFRAPLTPRLSRRDLSLKGFPLPPQSWMSPE